jgi:hypothetical protein
MINGNQLRYSIITILIFIFVSLSADAQRKNAYGQNIKMYKADRVIIGLNYLQWNDLAPEISLKGVNRGFYLGYFFDNPLGGSRFSLGVGFSLTANNLYSDAIPFYLVDSTADNYTGFIKIRDVAPHHHDFVNNKMVFTYASVPFEIRLRLGKNELLKFAAGFEAGYLISSYVKYNGNNIFTDTDENIKFKFFKIVNVMKLRYGVLFRFGYNRFGIRVFYPLTVNFEKDKGPQFYPVEIGMTLMVF